MTEPDRRLPTEPADPSDSRPSRPRGPDVETERAAQNRTTIIIVAVVLLAAAAGGYVWNSRRTVPPAASPPPATEAPAAAPAAPAVRHPVHDIAQPEAPAAGDVAQTNDQVRSLLVDWLGRDAVQQFLQLDDFVRHAVVTVDNLGRPHAAPRLWPVNPTAGRYAVEAKGELLYPTADNAQRYAAFIAFVEQIDARRAAALYARHYALFQKQYEELGYPGRYFNDRLVEVIDLMIATPIPEQAPALKLTEVKGPVASTHPWLRYEFADPALEALPAGQKTMLRVGPEQQKRLRARLVELRAALTRSTPPR